MMPKLLRMLMMPPDCRQVAAVLQSYLDGELSESEAPKVAEHLKHCERCGIEAEVYEQVKRSLEQLATPPEPDALDRLRTFAEGLTSDDGA